MPPTAGTGIASCDGAEESDRLDTELAAELFTTITENAQDFVARHREIVEDLASPTGFEPVLPP